MKIIEKLHEVGKELLLYKIGRMMLFFPYEIISDYDYWLIFYSDFKRNNYLMIARDGI